MNATSSSVSVAATVDDLVVATRAALPRLFTSLVARFFEEGSKLALIVARSIDEREERKSLTFVTTLALGDLEKRSLAALVGDDRDVAKHEICAWAHALLSELTLYVDNEDKLSTVELTPDRVLFTIFRFLREVRTFDGSPVGPPRTLSGHAVGCVVGRCAAACKQAKPASSEADR